MFRKTARQAGWPPADVAWRQTALGTLRGPCSTSRRALPGVTVTIRHLETNTVQTSVSSGDGKYFVPNLRPGAYELLSELSGFAPQRQTLELRVGQDLTVNVAMRLAGVAEAVEVVGQSVAVETQSTLATVITQQADRRPSDHRAEFQRARDHRAGRHRLDGDGHRPGHGRVDLRAAPVHQRDRRRRRVEPDAVLRPAGERLPAGLDSGIPGADQCVHAPSTGRRRAACST